jgi:HEPN domain-containing protein
MNSRDAASDLLALAREDLSSARALHAAEGISERSVGFHAQQAVEKALKTVLAVQVPSSPSRTTSPC